VWGDRTRLYQLLDNLVSNAVKFTAAGGRVEVSARTVDDWAVVAVSDTGIGIPPEDLERLFERFFRASGAAAHAIPGSGLGLTIAKAIVDGHGGRITAESEVGVGSKFSVELPLTASGGRAGRPGTR
jgi:signal transduction histidine kinase